MFVHLAVHATFSDVRRPTTGMLAEAVMKRPQLLNAVLRDALTVSLTKTVASGKPSGPLWLLLRQVKSKKSLRRTSGDDMLRSCLPVRVLATKGGWIRRRGRCRSWIGWYWRTIPRFVRPLFLVDGEVGTNMIGYRCAVTIVVGRIVSEGRYGSARGGERAYRSGDATCPRGVHDGPQGAFKTRIATPELIPPFHDVACA